ncbi:MAG: hypothetical protein JW965_01215 [Bacteroidales bacterium]|nr:hypothetical protein [Bacteroidales bacterium]
MNKLVLAFFIMGLVPGMIADGIDGNVYNIKQDQVSSAFYPGTDTSRTNPYLKIKKIELEILTPSSGIQLYKGGLLFLSQSKMEERMLSNHISFGDMKLFYASLKDSVLGDPIPIKTNTQLIVPADGISYSSKMSRFFYSKLSERDGKVKIFMAETDRSGNDLDWEITNRLLGFCTDYNYTHPTISHEGDFMIFSSDIPGGVGGLDLYLTRYVNNYWTDPINLGKEINSEGSEFYACLDGDNNLFFSSDGLDGLGGYDIFFCSFNGTDWDDPVNLSDQINTDNDEVAFKIDREGKNIGFYTMIEKTGLGKKKIKRTLYSIALDDKYRYTGAFMLSDVLRDYAMGSTPIAGYKDDEEIKVTIKQAEDSITDSLKAEQLIAEKLAEERRVSDSLKAEELEAERLAAEKLEAERIADEKRMADSLRLEELRQEKAEAAKNKVIYRVQILSSTKKGGTYNIVIDGTKYDTWEYYYKGAWRITVGEFELLSDAREMQNKCRASGYDQAFVAAFINNERSLDINLFRR